MGQLVYGVGDSRQTFVMDNETLLHVQAAMQLRFRKDGAGFSIGIAHEEAGPTAWTFIWVHPSIPIAFKYDNVDPLELDLEKAKEFAEHAAQPFGLAFPAENRPRLVRGDE
ncbi:hypothetical protein EV641_109209 [Rhodococcus sp. SMB37]|uniref:DUF7882 family protein n=1 Tax=Rhodococcus sp. SMB37 TaxID=2512213 RepID=UPI0010441B9B|nr:hypothetical protein [Rhodococcus sp. SMB37]TCN51818.1 hypothetical protein EV641_109209 [Rhodococcus sp. SMB37]